MAKVTEVADDTGIEFLDTDVDEMQEDVDYRHFRTESPIEIGLGDTAGHPVTTTAQHFIVAQIDVEADEMQQAMGMAPRVQEASIFISNEDGEVGAGLEDAQIQGTVEQEEGEDGETTYTVTEEATIDDAIEAFVDEYL